ncbi:MAG: S41 family peptidase [bacterium]|nr:S41 family peptidase [bacterium]
MNFKYHKLIVIVLALAGGFLAGMFFEKTMPYNLFPKASKEQPRTVATPEGVQFSTFFDAWNMIEANFMGAASLNKTNMEYGAASGLAESLGDPNTRFLDPEETKRLTENIVEGAELNTVKWELLERDIAYVKLFRFTRAADSDFASMVPAILQSKATSIILDLRDNPGGATDAFLNIAGRFFKKGETIAIESFGEGRGEFVHASQGKGELEAYPVVILINAKTASVAEVFAHAMQESKGSQLVGEPSMGKGTVQKILTLSGDTALVLTTSELLSPKKHAVSKSGLMPDVEVGTLEGGNDVQLKQAIQAIRSIANF